MRKGRKHASYIVFEEGKETRQLIGRREGNTRAYKVFEEGKETRELIKYLKKGRKHASLYSI